MGFIRPSTIATSRLLSSTHNLQFIIIDSFKTEKGNALMPYKHYSYVILKK